MTKILSTASATSTQVSILCDLAAAAVRSMFALFDGTVSLQGEGLAGRLRYDLGETDINPDLVRGRHSRSNSSGVAHEMMRRHF